MKSEILQIKRLLNQIEAEQESDPGKLRFFSYLPIEERQRILRAGNYDKQKVWGLLGLKGHKLITLITGVLHVDFEKCCVYLRNVETVDPACEEENGIILFVAKEAMEVEDFGFYFEGADIPFWKGDLNACFYPGESFTLSWENMLILEFK